MLLESYVYVIVYMNLVTEGSIFSIDVFTELKHGKRKYVSCKRNYMNKCRILYYTNLYKPENVTPVTVNVSVLF